MQSLCSFKTFDPSLIFPFHPLPSPWHPTGFSFCFFPGVLFICILLSSNSNKTIPCVTFSSSLNYLVVNEQQQLGLFFEFLWLKLSQNKKPWMTSNNHLHICILYIHICMYIFIYTVEIYAYIYFTEFLMKYILHELFFQLF